MVVAADRSLQSTVKKFLAFWKPSIGRRLTVSFTLFGLLIGYAVFIYLAISETNTFIDLASNAIGQRIAAVTAEDGARQGGALLQQLERMKADLAKYARDRHGILSQIQFDLYAQDGGQWRRLYLDAGGIVHTEAISDGADTRRLEKAREKKILTSSPFFFGAPDKVNVKIDITNEKSPQPFILSFDVHRFSLLKSLRENTYKGLIFFFGLLLVSRTLGYLFSNRFARPIEQLAEEAKMIASGQYGNRFSTGRKDEIGVLAEALNNMASRIIDGTRERENLLIGILIALTRAIDAKSPWTAGHSERVTRLSEEIGRRLNLNDDQMRILGISAILHVIGKIAVPEQILDKPGKLTDEEFDIVKKHPRAGADIIASIPSYETILPGILHHHERWDGTGYPAGNAGKDIPLAARIICAADVYDALTADRPYRKAWSKEQTLRFFDEQKGKIFDPELAELVKSLRPEEKGEGARRDPNRLETGRPF